jgi:hypothetical protein
MKEPYGEGLASRTDPASCTASRKAGREALTGAHAGGVRAASPSVHSRHSDAVDAEILPDGCHPVGVKTDAWFR